MRNCILYIVYLLNRSALSFIIITERRNNRRDRITGEAELSGEAELQARPNYQAKPNYKRSRITGEAELQAKPNYRRGRITGVAELQA